MKIESGTELANDYHAPFLFRKFKHGYFIPFMTQYSSVDKALSIIKIKWMKETLLRHLMWAKFQQNKPLQRVLISTGSYKLVSEPDKRVGKILMEIRDLLNLTIEHPVGFTWLIKDKLAMGSGRDKQKFDVIIHSFKDKNIHCEKKGQTTHVYIPNYLWRDTSVLYVAFFIFKCALKKSVLILYESEFLMPFIVLHYFYDIDIIYLLNKVKNFQRIERDEIKIVRELSQKYGLTDVYFIGDPCMLKNSIMEYIGYLILITKTKMPPPCIKNLALSGLNCSYNDYTSLDNVNFENISELICTHNRLTNDIYNAKANKLIYFDASNNAISGCPPEWTFRNVRFLDLSNNKLSDPPVGLLDSVASFKGENCGLKNLPFKAAPHLNYLDLSDNPKLSPDVSFNNLPALRSLQLNKCNLKRLPMGINHITSLSVSHNKNISFNGLEKLKNLNFLDISFCNLKEIPNQIFQLCKLKELIISNNPITEIPDEITALSSLKLIISDNVPLKKFPPYLSINEIIDKPLLFGEEEKFYIKKEYKCEDPISMEDIEDTTDKVVFHLISPDAKAEQEFCYSVKDYKEWINKTDDVEYVGIMFTNIFAEWRRRYLMTAMEPNGLYGEPDMNKLLFKDPLNNFLINIPNINITREFYLLEYAKNIRLGNTRGIIGMSMHHGQEPGYTTYVAVSKDLFDGRLGSITIKDKFGRIKADDPLIKKYVKRFTIDDCSIPQNVPRFAFA